MSIGHLHAVSLSGKPINEIFLREIFSERGGLPAADQATEKAEKLGMRA